MTTVKLLLAFVVGIPLLIVSGALYIFMQVPSAEKIKGCFKTSMNQVDLCPGSKDYVLLSKISSLMQKTVILTEDSLFFQHKGFDWQSIEKSAKENFEKGTYVRGGSTITQQLSKNLFLSKEKSLYRKFMEGLITLKIERVLSKNEILERYLNVIEFGKGIYGIKAASRHYFKKSPSELSAAESAFLAMLLPNPVKYSASFSRKELTNFAESRIRKILTDMHQYHRIDEYTYQTALVEMASLVSPQNMKSVAPQLQEQSDDNLEIDEIWLEEVNNTEPTHPVVNTEAPSSEKTPDTIETMEENTAETETY